MREYLHEALKELENRGLRRFLKTVESDQGPEIVYQGRKYLNFSSNNYLGLADHPILKEASIKAVKEYGTGSGASRLITGSMTLHEKLEQKIAEFKGTEAALVFNSGYHANIGVVSSLMGEGDSIFSDELNHASLIDGCRLSKARTQVYRHCDMGQLEELLVDSGSWRVDRRKTDHDSRFTIHDPRRLILTDTLFSMDGDLCPLPQIMELAEKYEATVFVDEAHATGVFGKNGRGVVEHFGIQIPPVPPLSKGGQGGFRLIQMGTLGKALGSFGAYVCGPRELIDYLINRSRTFIYTTALPPAVISASLAAVELIERDGTLREKLWENIEYFSKHCHPRENGDPWIPAFAGMTQTSPIIPIIIGNAKKTMEISQKLFEAGIWATGIRPPSVPEGLSRIRLTITAGHTKKHLDRCLEVLNAQAKNFQQGT
ncbi:MAG: 8-amino-7-oxononanoate synthase [Deltaproteobacteria bacterium]|nr:8-amino-7-oxononanoate synthase [Deltaproteobacteria bacterium]